MMKKDIQNNEEAVKIMAGILLDRVLMDQEDQIEATTKEQWIKKLRNYRRCSLRTRKAFQELMHRVSSPVSTQPEVETHSDSLT